METSITINIDDYLSESEKKEYAIEAFKDSVKKELFKSQSGTVQSDSEIQRIIGNITSEIVFQEVQNYIPDFREKIVQSVKKAILKSDFKYEIFKKKDAWGREDSLAVTYMKEVIESEKESFQNRIKEFMANYDLSKDIREEVSGYFDTIAGNMYAISELFHGKSDKS